MAKSASRANRNPENPANPVNPDSDKDAQASATASGSSLPLWACRGRFALKRACGLGKRAAFRHLCVYPKNAKPPEVRRALPIRMLPNSPDPATDHAAARGGAVQRTRPVDVRNHNRQKWTPERRHRRPELLTGGFSAVRQRLREWLCDGADRSAPSPNRIDVRARFAPLMRWVLSLWTSSDLALAIDPTTLSDRLCVIVASVVCRGCAIPVAWVAMPANKPGKWIDPAREPLTACRSPFPRNGVQRQVKTPSGDDNRHLGRGLGRAVDYPDRPPAGGGRGVVARDALPDGNGVQGAEKRGLAAAENSVDRPRAGGAPPARPVGRDAADARLRQPGGGRPGAETESERAAGAAESGAGAQSHRGRISPWLDDAEPSFGKRAGCGGARGCCPNLDRLRRTA